MNAGDVMLLHFPFSDLSGAKLRPAVVLAVIDSGDFIASQVTTKFLAHRHPIELSAASFAAGSLQKKSFVLPGKLFTAHRSVIVKRVGRLNDFVLDGIREAAIRLIRGS
jgi:mRNA interferase MazF